MPQTAAVLKNKLKKLFTFLYSKNNKNHSQNTADHLPKQENTQYWEEYQNLKAEDIMLPRTDIVAISRNSSLEEIGQVFLDSRHTRIPIYQDTLDNIIGFINIKDILLYLLKPQLSSEFSLDKILRQSLIIPVSMRIFDLLEKMRQTRTHIALVVDEFGGVDGLITIENLMEEIIGKIEDEHDPNDDNLFKKIDDYNFEASGRIEIDQLEKKLDLNLSQEGFDTLGGLILSISGSVPEKSCQITHADTGLVFKIIDSDLRRIKRVLIHKPQQII